MSLVIFADQVYMDPTAFFGIFVRGPLQCFVVNVRKFSMKYVHLELLYEPGLKSFTKTLELTNWLGCYFSSDMVLISLYIKRRNKGGTSICKYPN